MKLVTADTSTQGHVVLSMAVKCKVMLLAIYTVITAAPFVHEFGDGNK